MMRPLWGLLLIGGIVVSLSACAGRGRVTVYDLGVAAYDRGEFGLALEYYKEALMQEPDHLRARFNLALVYHDQQRYALAKEHYRALLMRYPNHARSLVNLADIAMHDGDPSQAHLFLLRAVEAEPDRAYPYSFLGRYLQHQKKRAQARIAYERALAIEDDALTRYRLGTLWMEQGNPERAQKEFIQAIRLDDNYGDALYQLALMAIQNGGRSDALRYLQRLAHLRPHQAHVFTLLGRLYLEQQQYPTAALHLWEARDLAPVSAEVEQLLLKAYQHMLKHQQEVVNRLPDASPTPAADSPPKRHEARYLSSITR